MDARLCHLWFSNVFVRNLRLSGMGTAERPVVLIWDNCSAHVVPEYHEPHVRVILLPPNCTSALQPMDQGIIASIKRSYRSEVLSRLLADVDTVVSRQTSGKQKLTGTAGLEHGLDPHVGDVATITAQSWKNLPPTMIINCWLKSTILPPSHHSHLQDRTGSGDKVCF